MTTTVATQTALRIRGLVKRFPSFELGPLDLNVPAGAVYGLIGPNGAGKTTTLDLVMGMGAEDEGTIEVMGLDHRAQEAQVKASVGYVSPELSYNAWGRVGRLLDFLRPYYPTWDEQYCGQLLHRFELKREDKIATLSLGNRTRLALVAALARRPRLLVLDEPTTGLDAVGKHQFFEEMMDLMQAEESTVVISSHNLSDLERFADHLGMIHRGRLLLEGSAAELIERHRMVDVEAAGGWAPQAAGLRMVRRTGDRLRVLVDESQPAARAALAEARILSETPVSLEELFVALVGRQED